MVQWHREAHIFSSPWMSGNTRQWLEMELSRAKNKAEALWVCRPGGIGFVPLVDFHSSIWTSAPTHAHFAHTSPGLKVARRNHVDGVLPSWGLGFWRSGRVHLWNGSTLKYKRGDKVWSHLRERALSSGLPSRETRALYEAKGKKKKKKKRAEKRSLNDATCRCLKERKGFASLT